LAACVSFGLAFFEDDGTEGIRAFIEPAVILLILILNAAVGVWQESNAENALEALKEMSAETARCIRNGRMIPELPARELVPGDVIEIVAGDRVPADSRVLKLKTAILRAEQSALTGESVAVQKTASALAPSGCELQSKESMLFSGTGIASGTAIAVVNTTGMATEIGKIQEQIEEAADEDSDTPLKRKLDEFGEMLAKSILVVCILVWVINIHHFLSYKTLPGSTWIPDLSTIQFSLAKATFYFKVAVALAVAAIPEGLPAVITTCLALGTRKMAKRNAIVRRLPSVETLGCTTVICSDKTGTLTTNQMSAVTLVAFGPSTASLRDLEVDGSTFDPDAGSIIGVNTIDAAMVATAEVCALCNDARLDLKHGVYKAIGQATEAALLVLVEKIGLGDAAKQRKIRANREDNPTGACSVYASKYQKLATLEFDRDRKSMSVLCAPAGSITKAPAAAATEAAPTSSGPTTRRSTRRWSFSPSKKGPVVQGDADDASASAAAAAPSASTATGSNVLFVKGAAECVLQRCTKVMLSDGRVVALDKAARTRVAKLMDAKAGHALRLLAFAIKPAAELDPVLSNYNGSESHPAQKLLVNPSGYSDIESGLTFIGLAGLRDPPRPEVASAIADCHAAGIRVMVITGDNKLTAEAVCRDIGVFTNTQNIESRSMTGTEFVSLSLSEQQEVMEQPGGLCFSRAEPRHKQDIVRLLKDMGEVCAMTGDGVNDAPALKLADIGVAMGIAGTEVAKQASDMVLADDNFATVVAAVEEGRAIYNNMKAFIRYMISSNIGEVASIFLSAALGLPEGLIPVQLLWVNLVTDGPPATALGFNKADPDIMSKAPRRSDDHFITPWIFFRWLFVGAYVGFATVGVFATWYTSTTFFGIDLSQDGHTPVSLAQLRAWESCPTWAAAAKFKPQPYTAGAATISFESPCDYFTTGKIKASTLSLSVLVAIEMFNAANALSEDNSLLTVPVWTNPWLLVAMAISFGLHFIILYVPFLAEIFSIVPLSFNEWLLVLAYSLPVILIDEVLKFIGRNFVNKTGGHVKTKME
jgi:P-type Ca2+ transporter type 2C